MVTADNNLASAKVSRKDQIESIATALFKQKGFAATSMRDLASEVGIEAASIYSHIKSKEEILQSVCFKMAREFFDGLNQLTQHEYSNAEKLRYIIKIHVKIITQNVAASVVFQNEWRHLSEPHLSRFLTLREEYGNRIQEILKAGSTIGEFTHTDAKFITRTLLSSLNGIPQWYKMDGKLSPDAIAENVADLFLNGITSHKENRPKYH